MTKFLNEQINILKKIIDAQDAKIKECEAKIKECDKNIKEQEVMIKEQEEKIKTINAVDYKIFYVHVCYNCGEMHNKLFYKCYNCQNIICSDCSINNISDDITIPYCSIDCIKNI